MSVCCGVRLGCHICAEGTVSGSVRKGPSLVPIKDHYYRVLSCGHCHRFLMPERRRKIKYRLHGGNRLHATTLLCITLHDGVRLLATTYPFPKGTVSSCLGIQFGYLALYHAL